MTLTSLFRDSVNGLWPRPKSVGVAEPPPDPLDSVEAPPDVRRLIRDRRYCKVLIPNDGILFDDLSLCFAWKAVYSEMAMVPAGEVTLATDLAVATHQGFQFEPATYDGIPVAAIYMDRTPVTNADYARFVAGGGYSNPELWPVEVLPDVLQFVDRTRKPGPRDWVEGRPPEGCELHPVAGVCWYEANAYAMWSGKRLPTSAEWQRAGTWANSRSSYGHEAKYPWGDAFDPSRANIWAARRGRTVAVQEFPDGCTPNGIRHLIGNVWEWVDAQFTLPGDGDIRLITEQPLAEVRGGAFDTYFESQATCQFRSGHPLLHRAPNVGFRCCVSSDMLPPEPTMPEPAPPKFAQPDLAAPESASHEPGPTSPPTSTTGVER